MGLPVCGGEHTLLWSPEENHLCCSSHPVKDVNYEAYKHKNPLFVAFPCSVGFFFLFLVFYFSDSILALTIFMATVNSIYCKRAKEENSDVVFLY